MITWHAYLSSKSGEGRRRGRWSVSAARRAALRHEEKNSWTVWTSRVLLVRASLFDLFPFCYYFLAFNIKATLWHSGDGALRRGLAAVTPADNLLQAEGAVMAAAWSETSTLSCSTVLNHSGCAHAEKGTTTNKNYFSFCDAGERGPAVQMGSSVCPLRLNDHKHRLSTAASRGVCTNSTRRYCSDDGGCL